MRVEILTIGSELVTGSLVDTNSAHIAEQCEMAGLEVIRHTSVGDNLNAITGILLEITKRADIGIVSGGLGPTLDDLTREAAAKASGFALELYPEALKSIEDIFRRLDHAMPEANKKQAFFPKHSIYLQNPIGSAPGFAVTIKNTEFYFVPGVPREMRQMLTEQVLPRILQKIDSSILEILNIKSLLTLGLSESIIGEHLESIEKEFPQINGGTRAILPEIEIKLYLRSKNLQESQSLMLEAAERLRSYVGNWVYAENNETMESVVGNLARKAGHSISIIECLNGGIIADWLTNTPNSSDFMFSSCVLNLEKIHQLLNEVTAVPALVRKLARKIQETNRTTYSIIICGASTPEEAKKLNIPLGTVYIAIADNLTVKSYSCNISFGGQEYKKKTFALLALDLLRRKLLNLNPLREIIMKPLIEYDVPE